MFRDWIYAFARWRARRLLNRSLWWKGVAWWAIEPPRGTVKHVDLTELPF
jgi:hypothetical protein